MDYHSICDIDTPECERRKRNIGDLWINAAECNKCKDTIRSKNRRDYVTCSCGNLSVDGGSWYAKRAWVEDHSFTEKLVAFSDVE